ncbi:MAG: ABC transporter permease [Vicinamibacterales bacterium]
MLRHLSELWRRRDLVAALAARDLQLRYKGSALGLAWSLMHPLIVAAVYFIAFRFFLRLQIPNYPLFLLTALLPWLFFASALGSATSAVTAHGQLVKKVAFPRGALPASAVAAQFVHFAVGYLVVVPALAAWQVGLAPTLLAVPVLMICLALFTCGLAFLTATAQVYLRDTRHLVEVALQIWFWATPIVYSLEVADLERYRGWFRVNPLFPFISAFRSALVERSWPSGLDVVSIAVITPVVFAGGFAVLARWQQRFAEYV